MSIVTVYRRSVLDFGRRARQVAAGQWSDPTPCADWDVRALVNHVVGEQLWTVPLLAGQTIEQVGNQFDGDLLGDDPAGRAEHAAAAAALAAAAPDLLDRTVSLSFGPTPAEEYLYQLLADHLIHGWDLAAAIGADRQLDEPAVRLCTPWFAGREAMYRESGAIGPAVPLDDDATDADRLLAAFGRDPRWQPA
jgi:uncharacterized protein (TIGR03086 family)